VLTRANMLRWVLGCVPRQTWGGRCTSPRGKHKAATTQAEWQWPIQIEATVRCAGLQRSKVAPCVKKCRI
jgi:hypothetical protein